MKRSTNNNYTAKLIAYGIIIIIASLLLISLLRQIKATGANAGITKISDSEVPLAETVEETTERDLVERELLAALSSCKESGSKKLSKGMPVSEARVFRYEFYASHPEITLCYSPKFRCSGYAMESNLCFGYYVDFLSAKGGKSRMEELDAVTAGTIYNMRNKSDMKKLLAAKELICEKCRYTDTPAGIWDDCMYGCLVKGQATCLGYAEALYYMMYKLHVPCRIVTNSAHAWNVVCIDGKWEKVDLTGR